MLQDFPDAPLFITQGRMPTENAPLILLPQTNVSGTDSYTANGVYPTFDARQAWTTTSENVHWGGIHDPRPPNINAFFPEGRFHVSLPSPVSSNSASSIPSPTFTTFPPRQIGVSTTENSIFPAFRPSQMVASPTVYCNTNITSSIDCTSNAYTPVRDTLQLLNRPMNRKGDWPVSREVVNTVRFSKYTVLGRIQEIGNGVSARDALESIASLIEAEPLPSRGQTVNELRMGAVQNICRAFDALKRTGGLPHDTATSNGDSALAEARAEEAARLLMGLINLGIMKPGDLTIPVKIIFESDRRYMYLAKAILENSKCLAFTYTAVKWLQSMAADLQDAEDVKYIIGQIKTPPRPYRPHRRW